MVRTVKGKKKVLIQIIKLKILYFQMSSPRILLLSNSKLHGQEFFDWCSETLKSFLTK